MSDITLREHLVDCNTKDNNKGARGCMLIILFLILAIASGIFTSKYKSDQSSPIYIVSLIFLIITLIAFFITLITSFGKNLKPIIFFCPNCYKVIDSISVVYDCPACNKKSGFDDLISGCKKCKTIISTMVCPNCNRDINLNTKYDEESIRQKYNS